MWSTIHERSRALAHSRICISAQKGRHYPPSLTLMKPTLVRLFDIYDRYLACAEEPPWWYTERSIVGHLTAAAHAAGFVSIPEFGLQRRKRLGCADWWVSAPDRSMELFIESKQLWKAARSSWDCAYDALSSAANQLNDHPAIARRTFRVSLCFVRAYCNKSASPADWRRSWLELTEQIDDVKVSYYGYYWLTQSRRDFPIRTKGRLHYWHPGVFMLFKDEDAKRRGKRTK